VNSFLFQPVLWTPIFYVLEKNAAKQFGNKISTLGKDACYPIREERGGHSEVGWN
jgi:hypothetical protein